MKIFLDTANIESIKRYNDMGAVDGVTTNPTLLSKEKGHPAEIMREITKLIKGPVSLEVVGIETDGMIEEAHRLTKFGPNVIVKIPMIPEGLKAVRQLREEGIKTNVTLIFSSNQALLAAKAGASYVSPFIGRIDDSGWDGMLLIEQLSHIFQVQGYKSEILAASIRSPNHIIRCAEAGADVVTSPLDSILGLLKHPLTDIGLAKFLEDAKKSA